MTTMIEVADLKEAYEGSYYTITGTGGDLAEWVEGYNSLLAEAGIGTPTKWLQTTGTAINAYAHSKGEVIDDLYPADLTFLLFPLDGLDSKLMMFKIVNEDRWFDDVINNLAAREPEEED